MKHRKGLRHTLTGSVCAVLFGCGGGGDSDGGLPTPPPPSEFEYTAGVYEPSSNFEARCEMPRTGVDPATGAPFPDEEGSTFAENLWLRSWTNELYLWYDEVPDEDPTPYDSTLDYFEVLKTAETTPSGNPKDQFHFTYPTEQWVALSQSGVEAGYGAEWIIIQGTPPRQVVVAFTEPGSPAEASNIARGAEVLEVDGVDLVNANTNAEIDTLNAGLFPAEGGEQHTFTIRDIGSSTERTVTLTSDEITSDPVQNVRTISTGSGPVGYLLFNDHIATAESQLIDAVEQLSDNNVTDLILDVRYNGGGYLDLASELAFMIAGTARTSGEIFEETVFNDKHTTQNPVTGQPLEPIPFHSTSQGFSGPVGVTLPSLNLARVFVLTGPNTCSASESIINSLRGVDVEVIQIGSTTCGKPYGFYPTDNCGTTYFSIQFQGLNDKGFGDYADGFSPFNTASNSGVTVPGCSVADDFTRELGDTNEGRLAAALAFREDPSSCSVPPSGVAKATLGRGLDAADGVMRKSPFRENRVLRR